MKRFNSWGKTIFAKRTVISLPKFMLLITPFTVVLLAIMILAVQINRQLYEQQQIIVNRLSHAAVRHSGQLQREHLRFWSIIAATGEAIDQEIYREHHDLVQSRIRVLEITLSAAAPDQKVWDLFDEYVRQWQALQPLLAIWQADPQNLAVKARIGTRMADFERNINQITLEVQIQFEDRMQNWTDKSLFLNRLLTVGSFSFIVIILLMTYGIYLLFKEQVGHQDILRTSEQRLRVILDAIPDAVYRVTNTGIYTDYKPAANEAFRLPEESYDQKHLRDVLPSETAALIQGGIQTVLMTQEPLLIEYPLADAADQLIRHYEARLLASGTDEVQMIVRDITEVKEQEETAIQAQKLESLGILAGGIAHDFNNLLTGMLGQASLAVAKLNRGMPALDQIQKVVISAERAADLTRQLLAYTGKGKFQIVLLDLNQLVRDTAALMNTVLSSQTELALTLQEDLPSVYVDRGQIQQVVMNLFINAIEALPEGKGAIAIATGARWIDENQNHTLATDGVQTSSNNKLATGLYVSLSVTDTGIGMEQATLSRIFDPFFSTKPKGHGLGLSATMGIVRTHHGSLHVQSQPHMGTTFTLLLPASEEKRAAPEVSAVIAPTKEGKQSILIIDDEAAVRETAMDILAESGFQVTTADNGYDGIDLFRNNYQQIDVVLLDMKMPGLNGTETYRELRQISPDLKVIFTSGYSDAAVDRQVHESESITFLPKPYTADLLTKQVYAMLAH